MLIYLASPLSNHDINEKIAKILSNIACECFLPQRDSISLDGKSTTESNIEAIKKADLMLIIGKRLGNDTSWEIGYAIAQGKPTVLLCENAERDKLQRHKMIFFSIDKIVSISLFNSPDEYLSKIINQAICNYNK